MFLRKKVVRWRAGRVQAGALKKVTSFDLDMKVAGWRAKIARRLRTAGVGWA